jgi:cation diffusion facilitator CzcD-associated flavoprotein CzcO
MSEPTAARVDEHRHEVLIVGAGFGGMCTAIKLKEAGIEDFLVLEKDGDLGGTWNVNTYPGCACDVQSHLYSFSFELNPDWSHMFAPQREIWDYQLRCAEKYGLRPHMRFDTAVKRMTYDEGGRCWRIETETGECYVASKVVLATGPLSRPSIPDIPGLERFEGKIFHSARWDHDYDLAGKRVAVIGTGASAIQFVPAIAPEVAELHLFQRTPPWVLPRPDRRISDFERSLFRRLPFTQRLVRAFLYWRLESRAVAFTLFPRLTKAVAYLARRNIERGMGDPVLREQLTPDYAPGCKRILLSDDYYPALARPNVHLVTSGIREVSERRVVCADGSSVEADAIILGTGFKATEPFPGGMILGREGIDINARWRDGIEGYKGMVVSGFPNLFMLMGPNTGLGHNSVVFMIECQLRYLMDCFRTMRRNGIAAVEVRSDVETRYNEQVQRRLGHTIWASGCKSWYLDARGRNVVLWPGFTVEYWARTRQFHLEDYVSEFASPEPLRAEPPGPRRDALSEAA